ncbi:MAG: hypothetical protein H6701_12940 [Myxococcales bacterium]|nr:hypothetical protein [Myxococcales bacterium]
MPHLDRLRPLALAALTLPALACQSEQTGEQGLLRFSYVTDDNPANFNKPVAVGARLDMRIEEAGGLFTGLRPDPTVTAATTEDEAVIRAAAFTRNVVTFEGIGAGTTKLTVTATLQSSGNKGKSVEDSVTFRAAVVDDVKLFHTCTLDRAGHYLTNTRGDLWLTYDFFADNALGNAEPVIGYGHHPITIEPAGSLTLDEASKDQQWFHFTGYPDTPTTVTVRGDAGGDAVTLNFVDPAAVQSARLIKFTDGCVGDGERDLCAFAGNELGTGFYLQPLVADDEPVCQADLAFELTVDTPDVCAVERAPNPNTDEETTSGGDDAPAQAPPTVGANEANWIRVVGKVIGTCRFTVTYPEGNGGAGAVTPLSVTIKGGEGDIAMQ